MKNYVYTLPCKPGSIYVNFGANCLNDCRFCVKRFGKFFGYKLDEKYSEKGIINGLKRIKQNCIKNKCRKPNEIVLCGIGEPFLRYKELIKITKYAKKLFGKKVPVRADTSGLWWKANKNLEFLDFIDSLSVSLNAESEEKYIQICQPKISNAFAVVMNFLETMAEEKKKRKNFPDIRLTLVDTSRKDLMPARKETDFPGDCPKPNITKCRKLADRLGFPLVVKHLFMDSHDCWDTEQLESGTLNGDYLKKCAECKMRHI